MKLSKTSKAFTLIELLVVISIIGMLSSVVLASLSTARDKGRVAAGKVFDTHTYQAFGVDATVIYNFDESSGNTIVYDSSGNNYTGTLRNSASLVSGLYGNGVNFNAALKSYIDTSVSDIGKPKSNNYTISAWIKPESFTQSDFQTIVGFGTLGWKTAAVFSVDVNKKINIDRWNNTVTSDNSNVLSGVWTHVAVSVSLSGTTLYFDFYQDGKLTDRKSVITDPNISPTPNSGIFIGNNPTYSSMSRPFNGMIDSVRIYTNSLSSAEIQQLYAEGLKTYQFAEAK